MRTRRELVAGAYYAVLVVLLVLAVTGTLRTVIPGPVGKHLAEDSEGLLLALLLSLWIQYVRPRLTGSRREWFVTGLAVVVDLALGLWLFGGAEGLPSRVFTLNETFLALAVLLPYVQLRRPLPAAVPLGLSGGVLLLVLVASRNTLITDLAETLAMLVLVPIGLDVVDRAVLDPTRWTPEVRRWSWYAFLLVVPACFALLFDAVGGEALRYAVRVQEAFVGLLLIELYFTIGLARTGQRRGVRQAADVPA